MTPDDAAVHRASGILAGLVCGLGVSGLVSDNWARYFCRCGVCGGLGSWAGGGDFGRFGLVESHWCIVLVGVEGFCIAAKWDLTPTAAEASHELTSAQPWQVSQDLTPERKGPRSECEHTRSRVGGGLAPAPAAPCSHECTGCVGAAE